MSSEPHHLHPAAMLIAAIKTIRRSLSAFVIPGVALLASRGFSLRTVALFLLAVALFGYGSVIAPARAELMYQPTVQSNTANASLNILEK